MLVHVLPLHRSANRLKHSSGSISDTMTNHSVSWNTCAYGSQYNQQTMYVCGAPAGRLRVYSWFVRCASFRLCGGDGWARERREGVDARNTFLLSQQLQQHQHTHTNTQATQAESCCCWLPAPPAHSTSHDDVFLLLMSKKNLLSRVAGRVGWCAFWWCTQGCSTRWGGGRESERRAVVVVERTPLSEKCVCNAILMLLTYISVRCYSLPHLLPPRLRCCSHSLSHSRWLFPFVYVFDTFFALSVSLARPHSFRASYCAYFSLALSLV